MPATKEVAVIDIRLRPRYVCEEDRFGGVIILENTENGGQPIKMWREEGLVFPREGVDETLWWSMADGCTSAVCLRRNGALHPAGNGFLEHYVTEENYKVPTNARGLSDGDSFNIVPGLDAVPEAPKP